MYRDKERFKQDPRIVVRSSPATFNKPFGWNSPALVFTCSWSDWFIAEADAWRADAWSIIRQTPHLTYQILTKRPERIMDNLPPDWGADGYPNVWIGVSCENQDTFNERVPLLARVPARVRFLSLEPLLAPIRFSGLLLAGQSKSIMSKIGWVIVGGESGNDTGAYRFRPCAIEWMENIVNACRASEIPVFVKQMGTDIAQRLQMVDRHGGSIEEFPRSLRVREFPVKTEIV